MVSGGKTDVVALKMRGLKIPVCNCRFKIIQRRPYAFCLLIGDTK